MKLSFLLWVCLSSLILSGLTECFSYACGPFWDCLNPQCEVRLKGKNGKRRLDTEIEGRNTKIARTKIDRIDTQTEEAEEIKETEEEQTVSCSFEQLFSVAEIRNHICSFLPKDQIHILSPLFRSFYLESGRCRKSLNFSRKKIIEALGKSDFSAEEVIQFLKFASIRYPRLEKISLVGLNELLTPQLLSAISTSFPLLVSVDLRGNALSKEHGKSLSQLNRLSKLKLSASKTQPEFFKGLEENKSKGQKTLLKSVGFYGGNKTESESNLSPELFAALIPYDSLEELQFIRTALPVQYTESFKNFQKLRLLAWSPVNGGTFEQNEQVMENISKIPHLTELILSHTGSFYLNPAAFLQMTKLEKLSIVGINVFLDNLRGMGALRNLKELNLYGVVATGMAEVNEFLGNLSGLTSLERLVLQSGDAVFFQNDWEEVFEMPAEQIIQDHLFNYCRIVYFLASRLPQLKYFEFSKTYIEKNLNLLPPESEYGMRRLIQFAMLALEGRNGLKIGDGFDRDPSVPTIPDLWAEDYEL